MSRFLFLFAFLFSMHAACAAEPLSPPLNGDVAAFQVVNAPVQLSQVILGADKGSVYLSDFKTNLVVLNIWATWCPPCVEELPSLNALQHAMGSNTFKVITVSIDTTGVAAVKKYLADNKLDMLTPYVDSNQDIQRLEDLRGMPGIPITLILDPQMKLLAKIQGEVDWNGRDAREMLEYYAKHVRYSPI
jgi:thiol-disulfide isomerase/thioredoxin